jgi:hypothetical protein
MATPVSQISIKSFTRFFYDDFFLGKSEKYTLLKVTLINGSIADQIIDIKNGDIVVLIDKLRNFVIINSSYQKEILKYIQYYEKIYDVSVEALIDRDIKNCILDPELTLSEKLYQFWRFR